MESMKIRLLNVGLGDCILLQFPDQSWAVIDCGQKFGRYSPHNQAHVFLANEAPTDTPIRFVLATHPDADHDGGIRQLLYLISQTRQIQAVYYSGIVRRMNPHAIGDDTQDGECSFLDAARDLDIPVVEELAQGMTLEFGEALSECNMEVLWPPEDRVDKARARNLNRTPALRNNVSVVLAFTYAGRTVVLAGDVQDGACVEAFARLGANRASVVKAPHHGAANGVLPAEALDTGRDGFVAISAPTGDPKHPHKDFMARIWSNGDAWKVRCTGLADFCSGHQKSEEWPVGLNEDSHLPKSLRRSLLSVGGEPRIMQLGIYEECWLDNVIEVTEGGQLSHSADRRSCDSRR